MNRIIVLLFFSFTLLSAQTLVVSGEKRFIPYFKSLEKKQGQLKFTIRDKNSSLEAFESLKSSIAKVAIVRGDILADNMAMKNYFEKNAFQDFKVISKLKEEFSTFLYFISKNDVTDAYILLNPDPQNKKMKKISIGLLKDLSNIYLSDIARSVNSDYRFRYKAYSAEESLGKIDDGSIDGAYLFVSKKFVFKVQKENFILKNITKPTNIKRDKFAKKIKEQKAFHQMPNGIRVDNYLIASSTLSDVELSALLFALKQNSNLIANIKPEYGEIDSRVAPMSIKIDIQKAQDEVEAEAKEKECQEAKEKGLEIASPKVSLKIYTKDATSKIKKVLSSIQQSEELSYFKPKLESLLISVKESNKEASKIMKKVSKDVSECNTAQVTATLIELNSKVAEIQSSRKELAQIRSEILQKEQLDKEMLAKEEQALAREEEASLKSEERAFSAELQREERALAVELEKEQREAVKKQEEKLEYILEEEQKEEENKNEEGGFFSVIKGLVN
jgi:hypothetical protein